MSISKLFKIYLELLWILVYDLSLVIFDWLLKHVGSLVF